MGVCVHGTGLALRLVQNRVGFFFFFWISKNLFPKGQYPNKQLKIVQSQRHPENTKIE